MSTDERDQHQQLVDADLAELLDRAEREPSPPAALGAAVGAAAGVAFGVVAFGLTENPVWLTTGLGLGTAAGVLLGTFRDRRGR